MGVVRVCKAFLPILKRQASAGGGAGGDHHRRYRSARILNVTSMAGLAPPGPMMGAYGASKHAAQGWSEALRAELAPWKIQVATVNPTFHRTPLVANPGAALRRVWDALPDATRREYGDASLAESQAAAERLMAQTCWNLEVLVDEIVRCLASPYLPMRVVVGMDGKLVLVALRMLPGWLLDWILAKTSPPRVPLAMKEREAAT
jgi:NAD(P)-dependent dehydrogenase (short-subunit alcohol dehydrogenase family)